MDNVLTIVIALLVYKFCCLALTLFDGIMYWIDFWCGKFVSGWEDQPTIKHLFFVMNCDIAIFTLFLVSYFRLCRILLCSDWPWPARIANFCFWSHSFVVMARGMEWEVGELRAVKHCLLLLRRFSLTGLGHWMNLFHKLCGSLTCLESAKLAFCPLCRLQRPEKGAVVFLLFFWHLFEVWYWGGGTFLFKSWAKNKNIDTFWVMLQFPFLMLYQNLSISFTSVDLYLFRWCLWSIFLLVIHTNNNF